LVKAQVFGTVIYTCTLGTPLMGLYIMKSIIFSLTREDIQAQLMSISLHELGGLNPSRLA
jgi:hypothetical protein